ncbi:NDR1/HIN1-like protein 10 [Typha angustifolia]|uniref:NDR1/HIN1-like protein 10 n=1 Tax=Typha angustifolia TaxID=59011 RepID=UPI003C2E7491
MSSTSDPKPPIVTGYPAHNGGAATSASGVAYPYPAPPPHAAPYYPVSAPPPYYPPPPPPYGNRNTAFLRRLLAFAVAFFLILGAATLLLWLILRPRLPQFSVSSASVSSFNLSSASSLLSADFDLTLTARNPNKKLGVHYDSISARIFYRGDSIAETYLPPFYQSKRNVSTVHARLVAMGEYVGADAVKGIESDRGNGNGVVRFQFRVFSWVVFNSGGWRTRRHAMRVSCDDVSIGFNSSKAMAGSMTGAPKQCRVDM